MFFSQIPGKQEIKNSLVQSVKEGRISHAQLFYGPEGSGNLALALAYARYISCVGKREDDACGSCPSCMKYNKLAHPDLHFAYPSQTSVSESLMDNFLPKWREALLDNPYLNQYQWYERIGMENKQGLIGTRDSGEVIRKLSLKSYESDYKIMIMWLPERMNANAANKLLKLIEEPPAGTVFLLVTESPEDIIITIRSRTQMVKIPSMRDEDVRQGLRLFAADAGDDAIEDAVRMAAGNFNKALGALRADEQNKYNFEKFVSLMRLSYAKKVKDLMDWNDEIAGKGREKQKMFLSYSLRLLRENFVLNLGKQEISHMARYENDFSTKFSRFINEKNIDRLYEEFNLAYNHISANAYARIVFLDLSLKIIRLLHL